MLGSSQPYGACPARDGEPRSDLLWMGTVCRSLPAAWHVGSSGVVTAESCRFIPGTNPSLPALASAPSVDLVGGDPGAIREIKTWPWERARCWPAGVALRCQWEGCEPSPAVRWQQDGLRGHCHPNVMRSEWPLCCWGTVVPRGCTCSPGIWPRWVCLWGLHQLCVFLPAVPVPRGSSGKH